MRRYDTAASCPEAGALASDSRFRPDRAALEAGDTSRAQRAKTELEERQRAERREREARVEEWGARWFDRAEQADLTKDELYEGTVGECASLTLA